MVVVGVCLLGVGADPVDAQGLLPRDCCLGVDNPPATMLY